MRYFRIAAACLVLAGCSTLRQEIDYPGGAPDYQANRLLPAFSGTDRANRYLIALTILSQLAAETASDAGKAANAAGEIARASRRIENLKSSPGNDFMFETKSYEVQASLYSLSKTIAINADMELNLRKLAELDVVWLIRQLGNLKRNVPAVRRTAAHYRDISLIVVNAVNEYCNGKTNEGSDCANLKIEDRTRDYALKPELPERGPLYDARGSARTLILTKEFNLWLQADRKSVLLKKDHVDALLKHIELACERLDKIQAVENDGAKTTCISK